MRYHWFLINANHAFTYFLWLFVEIERFLHAGDVLPIQRSHTPNYFSAKDSSHGFLERVS